MNEIEPGTPYLEYYPKTGGPLRRVALAQLPFTLGRSETTSLRIDSNQVSREHARIHREHGELRIKDLGSTNGTFVNGRRVQEARLEHGDIVHIATTELTYYSGRASAPVASTTQVVNQEEARAAQLGSPVAVVRAVRRLQEMLIHRSLRVYFQPVVDLKTESTLGYASDGIGAREAGSPAERYLLAAESRMTDRLNQMARLAAAEEASRLPPGKVFLPLQASEFGHESLVESLCALESVLTDAHTLVVEVPEIAVIDVAVMGPFHEQLAERGIAVAYSGFGAGRGRLNELAEVPPEFLKLDASLVQGLAADSGHQKQVRDTVAACEEHGIKVIAVGVEDDDDLRACAGLGCHAAQGAWFGPPQPLAALPWEVREVERVHA